MFAPRRRAVTLMEVLIALFIMAIGMLALLTLFPIGAVSMATALKDDRCAYASSMADNLATANNLLHGDDATALALAASPSGVVYVDPMGALAAAVNPGLATLGGTIPRVYPDMAKTRDPATGLLVPNPLLAARLFSSPDDITFAQNGTPDSSSTGGIIDRGRRYSWAYLLTRTLPAVVNPAPTLVYMHVVVYAGRPVNTLAQLPGENWLTLAAPGTPGTNFVAVTGVGLPLKRGGWIFESSNGIFYRVTNIAENVGALTTTVELETNLVPSAGAPAPITKIVAMDNVVEVFSKGPR